MEMDFAGSTVWECQMILERTFYYAKPGHEKEVLDLRIQGCLLRQEIGLQSGEVFVKTEGGMGGEPTVTWQCWFRTKEDREADLARRNETAEFVKLREAMWEHMTGLGMHVFEQVMFK